MFISIGCTLHIQYIQNNISILIRFYNIWWYLQVNLLRYRLNNMVVLNESENRQRERIVIFFVLKNCSKVSVIKNLRTFNIMRCSRWQFWEKRCFGEEITQMFEWKNAKQNKSKFEILMEVYCCANGFPCIARRIVQCNFPV